MRFQLPNKAYIRNDDNRYSQAFQAMEDAINRMADQTNAHPDSAEQAPPPPPDQLSVTEADGHHDIQLSYNSQAYRGLNHFAYYSQTPDFQNAHKIDMGASQNHRVYLGPGPYYWKANSAYPTSAPSADVFHGGSESQAVGSGTHVGPPMQQGLGDDGFGAQYSNSSVPPVRQ